MSVVIQDGSFEKVFSIAVFQCNSTSVWASSFVNIAKDLFVEFM